MERIVLVEPSPKDAWGVYDNGDGTQSKLRVDAWVYIDDNESPRMPLERRALNYDGHGCGDYMDNDSNFLGYYSSESKWEKLDENEYLPFPEKKYSYFDLPKIEVKPTTSEKSQ